MRKRKLTVLMVALSILSTFMFTTPALAENIDVEVSPDEVSRSIKRDYFMGVFSKKLMPVDNQRSKVNTSILEGSPKKYSLFDRFGGDIYFDRYMGEDRCYINFGDKIYTHMLNNPSQSESPTDVKGIADILSLKDGNFTTRYYNGRPDLKTEQGDPRVKEYKNYNSSRTDPSKELGAANFQLMVAKWINRVVAYLSSNKLLTQIKDVTIDYISSPRYKDVEAYVKIFVPLILSGTVVFIVGHALKIAKGNSSPKEFVVSIVSAICSFGLIFVLLGHPKGFIMANYKILSLGDTVASEILNKKAEIEGNEIVASDVKDNVVEASLWCKSIFEPWVRAEFGGLEYKDLYTQASKKPNPYKFHSEDIVGEISVPRSGKGDSVKNWGALLYSVNSPYHLPAIKEERETLVKTSKDELGNYKFPMAPFAGLSPSIYEDDFRVIDADTKVGQVKDEDLSDVAPYIDYRNYQFNGFSESNNMMFLSLLLVPIAYLGFKKIEYAVRAIYGFATVAVKSVLNVAFPKERSYAFSKNVTNGFFLPLMNYWFYTLLTVVEMLLYTSIVGKNMVANIFYIALSWYICKYVNPKGILKIEFDKNGMKKHFNDRIHMVRKNFINAKDSIDGSSLGEVLDRRMDEEREKRERLERDGCAYELKDENFRGANVITKEHYEGVLENKKLKRREREVYIDLNDKLISALTYGQMFDAIQEHRKTHRDLDYVILGIPKDQNASVEYYNRGKEINPDYNSSDDISTDLSNDRYGAQRRREMQDLSRAFEYINMSDTLTDEEYNRYLKDIKDEKRRLSHSSSIDMMQKSINALTGNPRGGSVFGIRSKVFILTAVLAIYYISMFIATLRGV